MTFTTGDLTHDDMRYFRLFIVVIGKLVAFWLIVKDLC